MSDTNTGRRKLLKSLGVGGAASITAKSLPSEWSKPVIDSVLLPSHALTSPPPPFVPDFHGSLPMNRVNGLTDVSAPGRIFQGIIDSVIPPAQACVCRNVEVVIQQCCTRPISSNRQAINLQVAFLIRRDVDGEGVNIEHWGARDVTVDGTPVTLTLLTGPCLGIGATISIDEIGAVSRGIVTLQTSASSWTANYEIPRGNQPLPAPQCGVPA